MENEYSKVFELISGELNSIKLEGNIDNEPQLQIEILKQIQQFLNTNNLEDYELRTQKREQNPKAGICPRVFILGRDYWPDMSIVRDEQPIIAIELKVSKKTKEGKSNKRDIEKSNLTKAIKETIGQCFINRAKFEYCIGFVKTTDKGKEKSVNATKNNENDDKFYKLLKDNKIKLIISSG